MTHCGPFQWTWPILGFSLRGFLNQPQEPSASIARLLREIITCSVSTNEEPPTDIPF